MTKRRRSAASSDAKECEEESTSSSTFHFPVKRRKKSVQSQDPAEIIQELYDTIRNYKTEDGRLLCEALIRVPKRRGAPEYYDVVSSPIDLLKIQQRMKMEEYDTVEQMETDVELMINNALAYYKKSSQEYKDASDIWRLFAGTKHRLLDDDSTTDDTKYLKEIGEFRLDKEEEEQSYEVFADRDPTDVTAVASCRQQVGSGPSTDLIGPARHLRAHCSITSVPSELPCKHEQPSQEEVKGQEEEEEEVQELKECEFAMENPCDPLEQLFTAVMAQREEDTDRNISLIFRKLPPRSQFPDYYDIIKNPIDMKVIAKNIRSGRYASLSDLEKDLLLMVKNAKTFNEPGSQVYKDAMVLKKLITSTKQELDRAIRMGEMASKTAPPVRGEQKESAIQVAANLPSDEDEDDNESLSAMQYEENDEESGAENFLANSSDAKHVLFNTVLNAKNSLGQLLSEPFMRLPIKRLYPDYYEEILHPMALCKIRSKLKMDRYESLAELAQDLDLIFNNAKHYNLPASRLYKDAEKLQKMMNTKYKELEKMESKRDTESDDEESDRGSSKRRRSSIKKCTDVDSDLKARMQIVYDTLVEYQDKDGRYPITLFMEKPSKKLYPDYYQVISEPIDMKTIEINIKTDKYVQEEMMVSDFDLLFNNARQYNEEGSMVYEDANFLERLLKDKCRELGFAVTEVSKGASKTKTTPVDPPKRLPSKRPRSMAGMTPLEQKLNDLYGTIYDYTDSNGRELAAPFIRLPTKNEYPEYYQVIKKPIDMQKIQQRLSAKQYEQLDDMVTDFLLMFDNACKFNEPDSLIYKDALTLQRVLLQTKSELMGDETSGMPDIQSTVREILTNLFVSLANHQDEEGRCFSDSLSEVPPVKEELAVTGEGETQPQLSQQKPKDLDTLRRYLDKGCYRRLDCFQDHIFGVLERARNLSRTDSQVYEDAIEMQRFFINIRDEICKNGEILLSPALSYTHRHMQNDIEKQKKDKLPKEMKEDAEKKEEEAKQLQQDVTGGDGKDAQEMNETEASNGLIVNGQTYRVGDFVYVEPSEKNLKLHIVCIEKLWSDPDGECWLHGNWYLRPNETFHLATRKFLEKEVFKSDYYNKVKISQHVVGKCHVMSVKDYFKYKPEGFNEEDVYTCESRYSAKAKAFKKIKIWAMPPSNVKIVPRDEPLSRVRIASVFADSQGIEPADSDNTDGEYQVFEKEREDVVVESPTDDEKWVYYEQLNFEGHVYKLGDCVYLRSDQARPFVARIDKMWKDGNGDPWFNGPWFVRPSETVHPPTRLFYKNEVFLSSIEDTNPMRSICGKCHVMLYKDYISSRPTEYAEEDIFVCESQYKEAERQIRKVKSLKRYSVSNKVVDDEVYFFKKPITPIKEASPLLQLASENSEEGEIEKEKPGLEEDDDKTVILTTEEETETSTAVATPKGAAKVGKASTSSDPRSASSQKVPKPRHASGFILFASEQRADVKKNNPKMSFGEISRLIGSDWRHLPSTDKNLYEERAAAIAETKAIEKASKEAANPPPTSQASGQPKGPVAGAIKVFECGWEGCDHQYDDQEDLLNHLVEAGEHLKPVGEPSELTYPCCWKGCSRYRKNQPFPALSRLIRHCKEVHMKATTGKYIYPQNLSRNFFSRFGHHAQEEGRSGTPGGGAIMGIVGPPTPVGMATQQLTHSSHASMSGMAMQSMLDPYPGGHMVGVGGHPPSMQGMVPPMAQPASVQHGMYMSMQPAGMGYQYPGAQHPGAQQHVMHVQPPGAAGQGQMMSPRGQQGVAPSPHGAPSPALNQGTMPSQSSSVQQPLVPPPPLFVPPPPRTQRLLHSEAYIRYIEGLSTNTENVSDWQRHLTVRPEDVAITPEQQARLPSNWLANKPSKESETLKALWKLRDLMLHDSLRISKAYNFDIKEEAKPDMITIET
ncbi:protein polybromo-1-like isoform X3 [Acanthaster planci]|uniref:Protein polybromo-1-like isoform X3 n=1 Tax=Acanthaster planci TaxID=133434 RepID=A0A8B7YTZ5_ACAPL|nr:protein polybromo-1-like isoform X3 [Acanthaster planci]